MIWQSPNELPLTLARRARYDAIGINSDARRTCVPRLINIPDWSVDESLASVPPELSLLPILLTARAGSGTHMIVRSDDDDIDHERAHRRTLDYRLRLMGAIVECL
jgi:hypothetical protein